MTLGSISTELQDMYNYSEKSGTCGFGGILFSAKIGNFKTHHTTQSKIAFWSKKRKGNDSDLEVIH